MGNQMHKLSRGRGDREVQAYKGGMGLCPERSPRAEPPEAERTLAFRCANQRQNCPLFVL